MFKFKLMFAALAMLATQSAFANTYNSINLGPPGSYSQVVTHTTNDAGQWFFTDTFNFTVNSLANTSGNALDNYSVLQVGSHFVTNGIDSFKVQLFSASNTKLFEFFNTPYDPTAIPLGDGKFSFGNITAGSYKMVVTGQVLGAGGSYTVNLNATAVPEADAYAMMLAGLGVVGFAARRKLAA